MSGLRITDAMKSDGDQYTFVFYRYSVRALTPYVSYRLLLPLLVPLSWSCLHEQQDFKINEHFTLFATLTFRTPWDATGHPL
jgi:hypothetical protein